MNTQPLVSILIPSYNHGVYIAETIMSACNQTYKNIEILVLDDGSTDNSCDVIRQLAAADPRIRWWQQPNAGLIQTLNRLFDQANGAFIAQIDSDDVWTPERIALGIQDMASDQSLSATFCSFIRINADGSPTQRADQLLIGELDHKSLLRRLTVKNTLCACTGFMRTSALKKLGYFAREYSLSHDWDRWLRLSMVGTLQLKNYIGALYRQHPENQSLDIDTTRKQELDIIEDLLPQMIEHHQLDAAQQAEIYSRAAALAYATHQPTRLVAHLLSKTTIYPMFEHEQIWFLHAILEEKRTKSSPHSYLAERAHPDLFSHENKKRLAQIMAYAP